MHNTGIVSSPTAFARHNTVGIIPEIPARAKTIHDAVWTDLRGPKLRAIEPQAASDEILRRTHHDTHLQRLAAIEAAPHRAANGGDNPFLVGTVDTARVAAGSVVAAIDAVMRGEVRNAFCAIRPPGHHAFPEHGEGFCYFNNVAVGAHHLIEKYELERVLILDWDLHHGNGTQACFYEDPRVLVVNIHGDPRGIYPRRSGFRDEKGAGAGEGFNLNLPLLPGTGDGNMQQAFLEQALPRIEQFKPQFVLISAGFDAHREDPFRYLQWSDEGYRWLSEQTLSIAERFAENRYVSVLEGGYSLSVLARVVPLHIDALIQKAQ